MNERPVRKTTRLKCYDYAQNGAYFVTVCVQEKRCLLGNAAGKNGAGRMVERWLHEIEKKFPGVLLDCYVVMPNHLHMILFLTGNAGGHAGPPLQASRNSTIKLPMQRCQNIAVGAGVPDGPCWTQAEAGKNVQPETPP